MPSNWYFKQADQELGPYTFRYISEMIREKTPTSEVLVRPCNADQWQWANSVVSLFHMARRDPATLPPVKNTVEENKDGSVLKTLISSPEEPVNQTEFKVVEEVEKPGWLKRLLSLRSSKIPAEPLVPIGTFTLISVDLYWMTPFWTHLKIG